MKYFKLRDNNLNSLILTGLVIMFFNSCQDLTEEELILADTTSNEELIPWSDFLYSIDTNSEMAFVQNGESIQDALNAAQPGDVVYIEPGTYQEDVTINTPDVSLIGLSLSKNDLVIKGKKEVKIDILKLYEHASTESFQKKSGQSLKKSRISGFERIALGNGVFHYSFILQVGDGLFDAVRLHRVVRERRPYHPVRTKGHVFMVHGAFTGFKGTFLAAGLESDADINAQSSSPFYLASENIDVWGIDLGWTMVPNSTTEFSFMDGWGYEKEASHTLKAMRIARLIRGFSGQGFSRLNLMGFSSGNTVAYAAANRETQQVCRWKRHIKGIITIDNAFKQENGDVGCNSAQGYLDQIAAGTFENTNGQFFQTIGYLALNIPDGISPIINDGTTTNIQAFRLVFAIDAFGFGFHFFGGDFTGLFYSDEMRALRTISNFSHYMPNLLWQEIDEVNCSTMNVSFDDYLNLISVPILYIGAGGGVGEAGYYTSSQTVSTDITNYLVSLDETAKDFGHMDNWHGNNADYLVWLELRNWILNHR